MHVMKSSHRNARCHVEAVALFERMDEEAKTDPDSWAYTHVVMSHVKDGMGAFRWPRTEAALRERLKHHFTLCAARPRPGLQHAFAGLRNAHASSRLWRAPCREQQGIAADRAAAAAGGTAGEHPGAAEPAASSYDEPLLEAELIAEEEHAGQEKDLNANGQPKQLPKWVPVSEFSRLRFKVLAEYANLDSWNR